MYNLCSSERGDTVTVRTVRKFSSTVDSRRKKAEHLTYRVHHA